jgi:hypothetical protein
VLAPTVPTPIKPILTGFNRLLQIWVLIIFE